MRVINITEHNHDGILLQLSPFVGHIAQSIVKLRSDCIVSNKEIDMVEVSKICTHDPNVETIRGCLHIFVNFAVCCIE